MVQAEGTARAQALRLEAFGPWRAPEAVPLENVSKEASRGTGGTVRRDLEVLEGSPGCCKEN